MKEKILIESKKDKKTIILLFLPGIIALILGFIIYVITTTVFTSSYTYHYHSLWEIGCVVYRIFYVIGGVALVAWLIILIGGYKISLTVTNTRVYGTAMFKKRVDLPLDSISAIGTSALHGVAIGTSSGKISFKFIKNNKEIHKVVSALLIERQNKPIAAATPVIQEAAQSNADELKKFKGLLDEGIITQEEFEAKKKELLGL